MDLTKLSYGKTAPEAALRKPMRGLASVNECEEMPVEDSAVAPAYKKAEGKRSAALIFVISGGEVRERAFLQELIQYKRPHSLRVVFLSKEKQGLQPYQMQKTWLKVQAEKRLETDGFAYSLLSFDKVYLLTDVDEYYGQLQNIIDAQSAEDAGQWIISNPCFEIWLYYCFADNPHEDLSPLKGLGADQRSKELKRLCNKVIKGGLDSRKAFENMKAGIEHSGKHYREDENSIPLLYATQMHKMALYIVNILNENGNEYDELLQEQSRIRTEWKQSTGK